MRAAMADRRSDRSTYSADRRAAHQRGSPQRSRQHGAIPNDTFPSAMNTAAAVNVKQRLAPSVTVQVCDEILAGKHHDMLSAPVYNLNARTMCFLLEVDMKAQ